MYKIGDRVKVKNPYDCEGVVTFVTNSEFGTELRIQTNISIRWIWAEYVEPLKQVNNIQKEIEAKYD